MSISHLFDRNTRNSYNTGGGGKTYLTEGVYIIFPSKLLVVLTAYHRKSFGTMRSRTVCTHPVPLVLRSMIFYESHGKQVKNFRKHHLQTFTPSI